MPVFRRVFSDAVAKLSRRIAFAARSDCVRRPIGLRSPSDWIAFAVRSDCVRCPTTRRELFSRSLLQLAFRRNSVVLTCPLAIVLYLFRSSQSSMSMRARLSFSGIVGSECLLNHPPRDSSSSCSFSSPLSYSAKKPTISPQG